MEWSGIHSRKEVKAARIGQLRPFLLQKSLGSPGKGIDDFAPAFLSQATDGGPIRLRMGSVYDMPITRNRECLTVNMGLSVAVPQVREGKGYAVIRWLSPDHIAFLSTIGSQDADLSADMMPVVPVMPMQRSGLVGLVAETRILIV